MQLVCPVCERSWPLSSRLQYQCTACQGNLEVRYDYDRWKREISREDLAQKPLDLWRYLPLYPVSSPVEDLPVGGTPCLRAPRLSERFGLDVWLKNDGLNPSASFKDRASVVALQWAKEHGYDTVAAASTGNAGAATALWGAVLQIPTVVFVPATAPEAKVAQLLAFGAQVVMVKGSYDDAFALCTEACERWGWFNRNTGLNPITREGKKSVSFELADQFDWDAPPFVVVPVGDGNIISGVWKGFRELLTLGWIDKAPRLIAVQAEGSAAIARAWSSGQPIAEIPANTVADSISVNRPRDGEAAVRAIQESGGWAEVVSDDAILQAIPDLAQHTGVFVEPAAAAALAGLQAAHAAQRIPSGSRVVLLLTGHGLKDAGAVRRCVTPPEPIAPTMTALEQQLQR